MKFNQKGFSDVIIISVIMGIIGALFILGIFVWGIIDNQQDFKPVLINSQPISEDYMKLVSEYCSGDVCRSYCRYDNCMWQDIEENQDHVFGLATFNGWYTTRDMKTRGGEDVVCNAFVIEEGPKPLIDAYKKIIGKGNSFNSLDENGRVIVNLGLGKLSESEKNIILNSDLDNPIQMIIFQNRPTGKGAIACQSALNILEVIDDGSSEEVSSNWQTYTNDEYGFTFEYPNDWKIVNNEEYIVGLSENILDPEDISFSRIYIKFKDNYNNLNLKDYYKDYKDDLKDLSVGGYEAVQFLVPGAVANTRTAVIFDGGILEIDKHNDYEPANSIYNVIIDSFKFLE